MEGWRMTGGGKLPQAVRQSPENEPTPHPLRAGVSGMNDPGAMLIYVTVSGLCESSQGTIGYERIEN